MCPKAFKIIFFAKAKWQPQRARLCVCMHVSTSGCVSVWQGGVGGAVNSHSCVRSNRRGFQSYLWQTKTKTGGRTRDADRVGDRETKTANDLIVSLSGLIFQANDYHMQTHIKNRVQRQGNRFLRSCVHRLLLCNCEAVFQPGVEKIPPASSVLSPALCHRKLPNASALSM